VIKTACPIFFQAAESVVLAVQRVVLFSVVFGIFQSFLVASLAVKEAELVLMPTACPLLECNKFNEIFVQRCFYVLNTIKPPNRASQTHNSVFFFKFPHGGRVTSIPTQISTSLATLFHKSHKCVASRHESADTLCSENKFSVAIWRFFPFLKMGICNRIFPLQKTRSSFADFSP
jgi:flagellar biosynthesis protein FliQ